MSTHAPNNRLEYPILTGRRSAEQFRKADRAKMRRERLKCDVCEESPHRPQRLNTPIVCPILTPRRKGIPLRGVKRTTRMTIAVFAGEDQTMNRSIIGTSEIVLSVNDLPKMREFYIDVLGFPLHSEICSTGDTEPGPNEEATITFLIIAETDTPLGRDKHPQMLVLIDYQRHVHAKPRFDGHDIRRSTLNHLAFEIRRENYDSEFERLSGLGLKPVKSEFENLNAIAIFFKDPEGNMLELICHDGKA